MKNLSSVKLKMPDVNSFNFQIHHTETDRESHNYQIDLHAHNEFELYINMSGDISFLVENSLYPLSRGDVILARPGELHHCVYRSDKPHSHFWILFDCEKNSDLLDFLKPFYNDNFISPKGTLREELLDICNSFTDEQISEEEKIYLFFRIFAILKQSKNEGTKISPKLPQDLSKIVSYIDEHIYEQLTVKEISNKLYISQSTLERRFKEILNITPLEFIKKKKLILAAQLLHSGEPVLQTGTKLGYNDNSYFIKLFKSYYGCTPFEYKKKKS